MASTHYLHLFDWNAAAKVREEIGDVLFDPWTEQEKNGETVFLYGVELQIDLYVNNGFGDFSHQGAPRWFDLITQKLSSSFDLNELKRAHDQLMPFLSPKYNICDLKPPPACSFVPTIASPDRAEEICQTLQSVNLSSISTSDLHIITQHIYPEQAPRKNPYFRTVSDLAKYLGLFAALFQQADRVRAGVVSYFD